MSGWPGGACRPTCGRCWTGAKSPAGTGPTEFHLPPIDRFLTLGNDKVFIETVSKAISRDFLGFEDMRFGVKKALLLILFPIVLISCSEEDPLGEEQVSVGVPLEDTADLPKPFNYSERLAFLDENPAYAARACRISGHTNIPVLGDVTTPPGAWDSPELIGVWKPAERSSTACFRGSKSACNNIVSTLKQYAQTNGITYSGPILNDDPWEWEHSDQFDQTRLEVDIAFTSLMGGYYFAKRQNLVSEFDSSIIDPWLKKTMGFYNTYRRYVQNNHLSSAALANVVTGLVIRDPDFVRRGQKQYITAIRAIRRDGSFPQETRRGASALDYTGLEISNLLMLAEYLAMAGVNVFDTRNTNVGIHKAVHYHLGILENWDGVMKYARANEAPNPTIPDRWNYKQQVLLYSPLNIVGLEIYRNRYPSHPNTARLANLVLDPRTCSYGTNREGREAFKGLCRSPTSKVSLMQLIEATMGQENMAMTRIHCMFGKP